MRRIFNFFLQGCLFVVPITVTIWVLIRAIIWIDSLLPFQIPVQYGDDKIFKIPGLGLIVLFLVVSVIGYIGTRYLRNPLFNYFESLVEKAPLAKLIYSSVKDLLQAFVGEKKRFNSPVLVKIETNSDIQRIGFITQDDLSEISLAKDKVAVYLPFSYSFAGELIIVPKANITPIDASGTDMMKFIISGGVTEIKD
jgi:uncharacterized membrane protein